MLHGRPPGHRRSLKPVVDISVQQPVKEICSSLIDLTRS